MRTLRHPLLRRVSCGVTLLCFLCFLIASGQELRGNLPAFAVYSNTKEPHLQMRV